MWSEGVSGIKAFSECFTSLTMSIVCSSENGSESSAGFVGTSMGSNRSTTLTNCYSY